MTGDQLIDEALTLLGVRYAGQTISPEAKATSLFGLNMLFGEWNAQGMAVFSIVRRSFPLIAAKTDYTIGPTAELVAPRPEKIDAWAVHSTTGSDAGKPVDAATFGRQRAALDTEAINLGLLPTTGVLQGQRVKVLNYDAAYPVGTVHVYPAPGAGMTIDLWTWDQLTEITDTTVAIDFPPGYLKAITYNLALDLAPKFGREASGTVKSVADACKAGLASTNVTQHSIPAPPAQQQ